MGKLVLSEFVEPELAAIADYIALDNAVAADRFLDAALTTFKQLAEMPGMGCPRVFKNSRLEKVRSFRIAGFENYLVFYGPIPGGIAVLHVLHGAMQVDKFFEA